MTWVRRVAKAVLPGPVRRLLRAPHRALVWRLAMRRFLRDPAAATASGGNVLPDLIYGWGNELYSALEEYLAACVRDALSAKGPILECGSGLTTLVVGVIAQRFGNTVWSLEHIAAHSARVVKQLRRYRVDAVRLHTHPLKEYPEFSWYDPPLDAMPDGFSLVVCDGPPGRTRGGRYGLAPVMRARMAPGCVILLGDAKRDGERAIAQRWSAELPATYETLGVKDPYVRLIVGDGR